MSTQKDKDRNSPISSSECLSGSSSPRLIRPPGLVVGKKQRSSSMNSIGSTHSAHQRSMSIISLELPRNSIVSIDDNYIRPTRNNSTASLSSMGPATAAASPSEPPKENYVISNRHKMRSKNTTSSAIVSDEDSELELYMVHGKVKWRRNSNEKAQRVLLLSSVKKDFKFRFEKKKAAGQLASSTPTLTSIASQLEDSMPSPHSSFSHDGFLLPHLHHHNHNHHLPAPPPLPQHAIPLHPSPQHINQSPPLQPHLPSTLWTQHNAHKHSQSPGSLSPEESDVSASRKKARSSSITQTMFLKRRMLLSKDLQLELLESSLSPNSISNTLNSDTKFPSPSLQYSRKPNHIIGDEPISPQLSLNPLRALRSPSPPPPGFHSLEVSSIRLQNKLITELNRKWNKATMEMTEKRLDLKDPTTASPSKKRDRSELVSSTDSYAIH